MKKLLFLSIFIFVTQVAGAQQRGKESDSLVGKRVFKIEFLSPFFDKITFGYEQAISKRVSLDFELGIIGVDHLSIYTNASGLLFKAGPCVYFNLNAENPDYKYKVLNRFEGAYLKPTISVSSYSFLYSRYNYKSNGSYTLEQEHQTNKLGAIMLNAGDQFVFKKVLALNFYIGIGYYTYFSPKTNYDSENEFSFYGLQPRFPIAIDGGIAIGLVSKY